MMKKIWGILAVLMLFWTAAWAGDDFSAANGDFQGFQLRESRDTTLSRYDGRIKNGLIWNGDIDRDGNIHFETRVANDIYSVELDFAHKQLARIFLFQRDGYNGLSAAKLEYYINEKLIRSISEEYGNPTYVFAFPRVGDIDIRPYALAEWFQWKNRITVGVAQDKKLHAVVVFDAVDLTDGN